MRARSICTCVRARPRSTWAARLSPRAPIATAFRGLKAPASMSEPTSFAELGAPHTTIELRLSARRILAGVRRRKCVFGGKLRVQTSALPASAPAEQRAREYEQDGNHGQRYDVRLDELADLENRLGERFPGDAHQDQYRRRACQIDREPERRAHAGGSGEQVHQRS